MHIVALKTHKNYYQTIKHYYYCYIIIIGEWCVELLVLFITL
jgi:hypothetical protein